MVKKFIQDNRVAVLYSPSYGSGWYTSWDDDRLDRLYDPEVVLWILHGRSEIILEALLKKYPRESERDLKDLHIEWVKVGQKFRIAEYDGSESVVFPEDENWLTA